MSAPRHAAALLLLTGLAAHAALAQDGVIELSEARAAAGAITPGDAPGFPITLSVAGSYRLSGNLEQVDVNVPVVVVTAPYASIDLAGFSIRGPIVCQGPPVPICSDVGTGAAIEAAAASEIVVRDGTIRGTGRGVVAGSCDVEGLRVSHTSGSGIACTGDASSVRFSTAALNLEHGIWIASGSIEHCTANANALDGLRTDPVGPAASSRVVGSVSTGNGSFGVGAAGAHLVAESEAYGNLAAGVSLGSGTVASGVVSVGNGVGIGLGGGNVVVGSVTGTNAADGHLAAAAGTLSGSVVAASTAYANVDTGFELRRGSLLVHGAAHGNAEAGVRAGSACSLHHDVVSNNEGAGIVAEGGSGLGGNVVDTNTGGAVVPLGTLVGTDANLCNGSFTCF